MWDNNLKQELEEIMNNLDNAEDEKYLDNVFVAKSSEMGGGLYRYGKGLCDRYLSIKDYLRLNS